MPSSSKKQKGFMAAVANNPSFAKKAGVPQSVGKDFAAADKAVSVKGGPRERPDLQKVNEPKTLQGKTELFKKGGDTMASKKMNPAFAAMIAKKKDGAKAPMPTKMAKGGGVEIKGKTKGKMITMKKGGKAC